MFHVKHFEIANRSIKSSLCITWVYFKSIRLFFWLIDSKRCRDGLPVYKLLIIPLLSEQGHFLSRSPGSMIARVYFE